MEISSICKDASAILLSSESLWIEGAYLCVFSKKPDYILYFNDSGLYLKDSEKGCNIIKENPFDVIEKFLSDGYYAAGYIGYDYAEHTDIAIKLADKKDKSTFPLLYFNFYKKDKIKLYGKKSVNGYSNLACEAPHNTSNNIRYSNGKDEYISKINTIKKYIEAGDVYQVNLSQTIESNRTGSPVDNFFRYFYSQPVPYGIYLDCDQFHFLGGSMEQFIEKKGNNITTKPIKGTSKRHKDPKRDKKIKSELRANPKEKAENLMIVDLMRNDLSRICKPGTVKVNKLFNVKSYRTLHQMESEIAGKLTENTKLRDIIYNIFPPGSVTGAPKKRSIEIIDELEGHSRGPYCGAAGVFSPNGDFTLCVSIRTAILAGNAVRYWAGSGIVYDSIPQKEYEETLLKTKAFLSSIN